MKPRTHITLILFLMLAIGLFFQVSRTKPSLSEKTSSAQAFPYLPVVVPHIAKAEKSPAARKPLKISSKGKVRLKPGESAVLGYWEIAPGMNGMAIVTPETTPEGQVKMTARLLQLSDAAVSDAAAHDLLPDLFDFENYSAIGPERLRELQSSLQNARGADMLSMPALISAAGQLARISIGNSNDSMLSLGLLADPVAENGGFDLSLELQRQE